MSNLLPLVYKNGDVTQLPSGDKLLGASLINFDNSTNGFTATDVQAAIEEGRYRFQYFYASGTSTLTRTANTFTTVSGMTTSGSTPVAGTYLVLWRADVEVGDVNGQGEIAVFVGGTQQTALTAQLELEVALLLGLIGTARVNAGAESLMGVVTVNGSQDVDIQYRSIDGQTVTITNRSFLLLRIA